MDEQCWLRTLERVGVGGIPVSDAPTRWLLGAVWWLGDTIELLPP